MNSNCGGGAPITHVTTMTENVTCWKVDAFALRWADETDMHLTRPADDIRHCQSPGAGVTEALCIVTPFEVVKIRLQQQVGSAAAKTATYHGPVDAAVKIVRTEGVLGLWSGATPTVIRNGTNQMCMFWAKANLDGILWNKYDNDGKVLLPWQSMISGFTAALLGPTATGPRPRAACIVRAKSVLVTRGKLELLHGNDV